MSRENIINCYNRTAASYAEKYLDEISRKHFDQILLRSFSHENPNGKMLDLGCGPGQTTQFLFGCGATCITGIDISIEMIKLASHLHPLINFEEGDMLNLHYSNSSIDAAIAFYAIVHFDNITLPLAFAEIKRVLKDNGQFLFSFHVGSESVHLDQFLGHDVNIDFHFFEIKKIIELLIKIGFSIIDVIERQPYPEIEYQSNRAYVWVRKSLHLT